MRATPFVARVSRAVSLMIVLCAQPGWSQTTYLAPSVVGPLSPANTYVEVENHISGATLRIFANGGEIGTKSNAIGGHDRVKLNTSLAPGLNITATQELAGSTSNPTPQPVIVDAIPMTLPAAYVWGPVYSCVQHIWILGMAPGAHFEVHQPAGNAAPSPTSLVGKGETYNGWALPRLDRPIDGGKPLVIRQIVGGQTVDAYYPMPIEPLPVINGRLLRPLIVADAKGCGSYVDLQQTWHGVILTVTRQRGGAIANFIDIGEQDSKRMGLSEPLQPYDVVFAQQSIDGACDINASTPSPNVNVQARQIGPPAIIPPVCRDADRIQLINAEPGATYEVHAVFQTSTGEHDEVIGVGQFPTNPSGWTFLNQVPHRADELPNSQPELWIQQTACAWNSVPSARVAMDLIQEQHQPKIVDPPMACAVFVRVGDVPAGSWVSIHSKLFGGDISSLPLGGEIGSAHATSDLVSVPLSSALIDQDSIWACVRGCQGKPTTSAPRQVAIFNSTLAAKIIEPVYPSDTTVMATLLVTGAKLYVVVTGPNHPGGRQEYTTFAPGPEAMVYVGKLYENDTVDIYQSLCHRTALDNRSNTAKVSLGTMQVVLSPDAFYLGSSGNLLVTATDPQRNNSPVAGAVIIDGHSAGMTNAQFVWTPPTSGTSVPVEVVADGYAKWIGSLKLGVWVPQGPGSVVGSTGSTTQPTAKKTPSFTYTCKSAGTRIDFENVQGTDFPPNTDVFILPQINGIYTIPTYGAVICGTNYTGPSQFGPFKTDGAGKLKASNIYASFACQPTCSATLKASFNSTAIFASSPECTCP